MPDRKYLNKIYRTGDEKEMNVCVLQMQALIQRQNKAIWNRFVTNVWIVNQNLRPQAKELNAQHADQYTQKKYKMGIIIDKNYKMLSGYWMFLPRR